MAAVFGAGGILPFAGMETALHLALLFSPSCWPAANGPSAWGWCSASFASTATTGCWPRPPSSSSSGCARRRLPWREAGVAGGLFGAWLLFAQLYFGSPLPNTLAAKAADVPFFDYLIAAFLQQARQILLPLHWLWPGTLKADFLLPALAVAALPFLVWAVRARPSPARLLRSGDPGLAAAALCGLLLWLGYAGIGPPLAHTWYLIPAAYCALLPGAGRLGQAAVAAPAGLPLGRPAGRRRPAAASVAQAKPGHRHGDAWLSAPTAPAPTASLAAWVSRHRLADTTVLTLEPGYLTYLSGQRAIDAAGLVSPGIYLPRSGRPAPRLRRPGRPLPARAWWCRAPPCSPRIRPRTALPARLHAGARPASSGCGATSTSSISMTLYAAWQGGAYACAGGAASPLGIIRWRSTSPPADSPFFLRRARLQKVRGLTWRAASPGAGGSSTAAARPAKPRPGARNS